MAIARPNSTTAPNAQTQWRGLSQNRAAPLRGTSEGRAEIRAPSASARKHGVGVCCRKRIVQVADEL